MATPLVCYAVLGLRLERNVASMVVEWLGRFLEFLRLPKLMRVSGLCGPLLPQLHTTPSLLALPVLLLLSRLTVCSKTQAAWVVPVRGTSTASNV